MTGSPMTETSGEFDVCLSVHRCICFQKKNQLDVTVCFIARMICSTCFGHFYAHHQELETILSCYRQWCAVLGCWLSGVTCRAAGCESRKRDVAEVQHPSSWTHTLLPLCSMQIRVGWVTSKHNWLCVEKKNKLDFTICFIALLICATFFGHFYAHHQEL